MQDLNLDTLIKVSGFLVIILFLFVFHQLLVAIHHAFELIGDFILLPTGICMAGLTIFMHLIFHRDLPLTGIAFFRLEVRARYLVDFLVVVTTVATRWWNVVRRSGRRCTHGVRTSFERLCARPFASRGTAEGSSRISFILASTRAPVSLKGNNIYNASNRLSNFHTSLIFEASSRIRPSIGVNAYVRFSFFFVDKGAFILGL